MNGPLPERPAQLDLGFVRRGYRTVLDRRVFRWPFVLTRTFALDRTPAHLLTAILQTSSSAVHGGDRLRQRIEVGARAGVHLTTQGATPIHGGPPSRPARDAVTIVVEPGGYLEYMPEARILFPDAALDQTLDVDCAAGATAILADAFTMHDPERRSRPFDRLRSTVTLRSAGEPLLIDRTDIGGADAAGLTPYKAFGTVTQVRPCGPADATALAAALSALLARVPGLYAAASPLPRDAGLLVRLAGHNLQPVRLATALVWKHLRQDTFGAAPSDRHLLLAAAAGDVGG